MSKFVNPFSDWGFKAIFGSEVSKDLIISFLNGVLHEEVIIDISFRNVEMLGLKHEQSKMPKFVLPLSKCDTIYLKWLYVLNNIDIMERLPEELNNQIFKKLKSIVEIERMSANERLEYELSLATERDLLAALDAKFEDGEMKGREEGIKEGMKEGKKEERIKIASKMKQIGISIPEITESTGLTTEEIEQL